MPTAAVDKVFEHLHVVHDALARAVGRRQPSPAGTDPAGGDPLESGKQLQAAMFRYDTLAACAPAAYQADAARHGIRSEAALRLTEELRGALPGFRPATQGQLQEELERQAAAPKEDIRHTCAHSWQLTASAPSKISGATTPKTSPGGRKPCGGP